MTHNSHNSSPPAVPPSTTSVTLLDRMRASDQTAWERFVTLYGPLVYEACRRFELQAADAKDVAQDVMHSVVRSIGKFRKERPEDTFRGWLYRIVENKVRDHYRRQVKRPAAVGGSDFRIVLEQFPEELSAESISQLSGADPALMRALELIRPDFEPQTWSAFWRIAVDGLSAAEIAAELGMNRNSVRQAKFRVAKRLRAEFGDLIELPE